MDKKDISEERICLVNFSDSNRYYSYKTFYGDLEYDDKLVVETPKGIKGVEFVCYIEDAKDVIGLDQSEVTDLKNYASKWIIYKVDNDKLNEYIEISNTKKEIKRCIEIMKTMEDGNGKNRMKGQLNSLLEFYSKLI